MAFFIYRVVIELNTISLLYDKSKLSKNFQIL